MLVSYLFVGGMAGGAYVISALADLLGKGKYRVLSKSGAYLSVLSILAGLVLLVVDLGRFNVDLLSPLNAYIHFPTSIMSFGTWTITVFMMVALLTSILWIFNGSTIVRKTLEVVGLVLGGTTAAYTGLLLAFSRGVHFWNTPFLPWLFIVSGSLTGLAMALILIPIVAKLVPSFSIDFKELFDDTRKFTDLLSTSMRYVVILIALELGLAVVELLVGGIYIDILEAGMIFTFAAYLIIGLVIPLGIAYYIGQQKMINEMSMSTMLSMGSFVLILVGGFLLRYVVLITGQLIA
jgi:formate-dependent nitrite reductase membrane component NrfD